MDHCRPFIHAAVLALCCSSTAMAHQSFVSDFSSASKVDLRGATTEVKSSNLHYSSSLPASPHYPVALTNTSFTHSINFEDVISALTRSGL